MSACNHIVNVSNEIAVGAIGANDVRLVVEWHQTTAKRLGLGEFLQF